MHWAKVERHDTCSEGRLARPYGERLRLWRPGHGRKAPHTARPYGRSSMRCPRMTDTQGKGSPLDPEYVPALQGVQLGEPEAGHVRSCTAESNAVLEAPLGRPWGIGAVGACCTTRLKCLRRLFAQGLGAPPGTAGARRMLDPSHLAALKHESVKLGPGPDPNAERCRGRAAGAIQARRRDGRRASGAIIGMA
jgi:hypothetical protein